jgi:agmatine deiminase
MSQDTKSDPKIPYRLPAEWEPQEAVWITWPQNLQTWQELLPEIENTYLKLCETLLAYTDLYVLGNSRELLATIRYKLGDTAHHKLNTIEVRTNDCWIRDYGGMTVVNGGNKRKVLNWRFNSWGEKYPPWDEDNRIPEVMAQTHNLPGVDVDLILEAGAIEVNGSGLLLTTAQCLLNDNRNPGYSRLKMEEVLAEYLGAQEVVWLQGGIAGDDTDGHVDNLARFVNEKTVFHAVESNKDDPNYTVLETNARTLETYAKEKNLDTIEIPMPSAVTIKGLRTPASYLNFSIINSAVLVPVFSDRQDEKVLALFEEHFPGRQIHPLDCRTLSCGQGGIHCISMQVPA